MKKEEMFNIIQEYTSNPPLILVGTGLTIPAGIPGMAELADYLQKNLNEKYKADAAWENVINKLNSGNDLETALSEDTLSISLINDMKRCTWELVNKADINCLKNTFVKGKQAPFSKTISKFIRPTGHHLDIITTNYKSEERRVPQIMTGI